MPGIGVPGRLVRAGAPLQQVQKLLGHASIRTTQRYASSRTASGKTSGASSAEPRAPTFAPRIRSWGESAGRLTCTNRVGAEGIEPPTAGV
ncbi:tyrosine-type recombinase/integrase [Streptomyces sp. NPDC059083]|uniref:tyrosine-type recombinase/integrase n=1 Tax=Actinomycetes TaxID=1760 RepID=UPI003699CD0E